MEELYQGEVKLSILQDVCYSMTTTFQERFREHGVAYPNYAFDGVGKIDEMTVRCLSAKYQVESHSGYELRNKDHMDVLAICEKFKIDLPVEYKQTSNPHEV